MTNLQEDLNFLPEDLLVILGPTASGKTKLAVQLARHLDAEIISADSRQVYRHMDIGTGKDLSEYQHIPYHLIDIVDPGEKYNIDRFLSDFDAAYDAIRSRGKRIVVCGGTGFYIQTLLQPQPFTQIPVDEGLRQRLSTKSTEELLAMLELLPIPQNFKVDSSTDKRLIRAIEICMYLDQHPSFVQKERRIYRYKVIGLNPSAEERRARITRRLHQRLEEGLVQEVEKLLAMGLSHENLEYYGLEYKYVSLFLKGKLSYDDFLTKLETEIHRFAKRQMTYFRKMEKDGIKIDWLS